MAVAIRGTRGGAGARGGSVLGGFSLRSFFSFRIFVSAMFSLLFIATLSVLFTTNPSTPLHHSVSPSFSYFLNYAKPFYKSIHSSFVVDFLEEATVLPWEGGFEFLMEYVILTLWVYGV
jgi:hypothetical protein